MTQYPAPPSGALPRIVSPALLWAGGCLEVTYEGRTVHGNFSPYLVCGSERTVLVDTGHAAHAQSVRKAVLEFLDGRTLDYIFPTHCELPHAGLLGQWGKEFPNAEIVGDVHDYHLYYPELEDRLRPMRVGDSLDLGDRRFEFVPAVWRDLAGTLWGFDTKDRVLFVSDAFAYLHYHERGDCDRMTSEQPLPDLKMVQFFNERALQWTRHVDARLTFPAIDALFERLQPAMIAPAHGGVVDDTTEGVVVPLLKEGMAV